MLVRGGPNVTGAATLKANVTAARVRVVGRRAFAIGMPRRTTVKIKLRKPALRQLRRKRRLRLTTRGVGAERGRAARRHERHDHAAGAAD